MIKIITYLSSTDGRNVKFISGAIIAAAGLFVSPLLVTIGLIPVFAAVFDLCIFAPFLKLPFEGDKLRNALKEK